MTRARLLAAVLGAGVLAVAPGCGGGAGGREPRATPSAASLLPDVRQAKDRPPVVLVSREGDPATAVSVAVVTAGLEAEDDAEPAVALAGVVEARLAARGQKAVVTPGWDGLRATLLARDASEARAASEALRAALVTPIKDDDLPAARKKLAALGARPLRDGSLARWARCTGSPFALPARAGKGGDDVGKDKLEAWRAAAHALGRVALGVAGPAASGEAVAAETAQGPAWKTGSPPPATRSAGSASVEADAYEVGADSPWSSAIVHATLDVATSSAAVATAEALGDPHGPLATRLAALETPFRLREVTGAAHARGGCVGVVLEASPSERGDRATADLPARVADAVALLHVEARVHLAEGGALADGRTLARRAGDAREAAERAAWWALADASADKAAELRGSVALGIPTRRGSQEPASTPRDALAAAIARSSAAWQRLVVEGKTRVEPGQGEAWVLLASPCGTDGEGDVDAGLAALVATTAAEMAELSPGARVEPWIAPDGVGLLVHGPALAGETPAAHARRLADAVARSFASDPIGGGSLTRARAELARRESPALVTLGAALAPGHPAWVAPWGREEITSRAADGAVLARAQTIRNGPLRVAVLANADAAQGEAALRAADRWVDRHGEARACKSPPAAAPSRPGTYAATPRPGASPEALLAYPIAAGDEAARVAAETVALALGGEGGLLERALVPGQGAAQAPPVAPLARAWSASVVGWPRAPALVVRVEAPQASLDGAVMQVRALVDRLRTGGLPDADRDRALAAASRAAVLGALDPRARLVATWRGETPRQATAEDVRAFTAKSLGEDGLVVVAARPGRRAAP